VIRFLLICLMSVCLFDQNTAQTAVVFEKEDLTFEIAGDVFMVSGLYYFHSEQQKHTSLLYPFPADSIYGKAFNISVAYANSAEPIDFHMGSDSNYIVFQLHINRDNPILIKYHQQLKSNAAKYILTSTQSWKQPLKQANFKLLTSPELVIQSFSYPPDVTTRIGDKKLYLWQKEHFMPDRDFEILFLP
jgi:hypothetical protein